MSTLPPDNSNPSASAESLSSEAAAELLQALRRKEGNWVAWGQSCQQLQKAGYSPQRIFEETGFEPIQQNQIIVAAQVYQSIADLDPAVLARFERTGSDLLYEFRILSQAQRRHAAAIAVDKDIDSDGARDIAKALKEFGWLSTPPSDFAAHPSDAVAHYYWKLARQQADLQARSRLIAQALRFASSESARRQVETLLTDFSISRPRTAPRLPFYRLESADEQPTLVAVAGKLPLPTADLKAVPLTEPEGSFNIVRFSGTGAWVAIPSWQVVRSAEDPVMVIASSDQLTETTEGTAEEVLVLIDRARRQWNADNYFAVDRSGQLDIRWFEEAPNLPILGQVVLVLRPKKVLDEDFNKELWQVEE
jgi:hypothetical protein